MTRYSLFTLLLALLISFTLQHTCIHDHLKQDLKISGPEYEMYEKGPGRFLLEYQNIQILVDASTLTGVSDDFENYIMNSVMPAVTNYFEATIKVPQRSKKLKAGGFSSMCSGDVKVPSIYNSVGVDADLILFVKAKNEPSASYVAAASACLLDTSTQRPIIGRMTYNIAKVTPTDNDADREKDIVTTMHELTHVLGFSSSLFPYYVDPNTGNTLKGHVITKSIMGYSTMILNTNALTTRVRNYFNCSTLPGAYLENQGGSGSAGSHFERRVFYNEYMTASSLIDSRVTEFTLALLEGTGWYQINYDMAEPMTWGKNKGCSFVEGACVNTATKKANFDEFCSPILSKGCSWTRRAGSSCGAFQLQVSSGLVSSTNWWGNNTVMTDTFADNCPIQIPYGNIDCEDPDNQDGATISGELYGYGSKCFMGTLYPKGKLASSYPFCFKSSCKVDSQGRNYIELKVGSRTVTCNSQKDISVSGYNGVLSCPDPDDFCGQIQSEGYCRRKCSGRGSCIQKNCACIEGWTGFDCSKPTYLDQCSRCQNDDPLRTSCYGDTCQCNPSNTTCMCLLGLKTGSACKAIIAANTAITTDDTSASASTSTPTTTNTTSNVTPSTTSSTSDNQAKNTPNSSSTATTNNSAVTTPNTSNPTNNVPDTSNNSTSDVPSNNIPSAPTTNSSTDTPTTDVSTTDPSSTQTNNTSSPSSDPSNTSTTTDPAPNPSSNNTTNTDSNPSPNSSESEEGEDVPVSTMTNSTTTIDSRVSVKAPADEKNGGSIVETIGSNTSNNVVLPAALGAVGGALTLAGVYLGVRYVKNFLAKRRRVQSGRTNSQAGRTINRPPKLQIPIASTKGVLHTEEHSVHSGQNSPDLSRGRESMRSHNDSPLISQHSPMKERTYPHSLFRNYITQNRMLDHDTKDFGLKIKPILPEGRAEDIENPELKSETPELTPAKIEGVSLQEIQIKKSSVRDSDE